MVSCGKSLEKFGRLKNSQHGEVGQRMKYKERGKNRGLIFVFCFFVLFSLVPFVCLVGLWDIKKRKKIRAYFRFCFIFFSSLSLSCRVMGYKEKGKNGELFVFVLFICFIF